MSSSLRDFALVNSLAAGVQLSAASGIRFLGLHNNLGIRFLGLHNNFVIAQEPPRSSKRDSMKLHPIWPMTLQCCQTRCRVLFSADFADNSSVSCLLFFSTLFADKKRRQLFKWDKKRAMVLLSSRGASFLPGVARMGMVPQQEVASREG